MGIVPLGLKENTIIVDGKPVTGHQNGTIANFKYFDYMWGKLKNIQTDGHSAWEDFSMDKQYCFIRLNIIFNGKPVKDMTQVTIKNIYTDGDFNLSTGQITYTNKGEMTVTADKPLEYFDIALLPDAHLRASFIIQTKSGITFHATMEQEYNYEKAKYYPYTITVKDPDPLIPIDGVKWGKYNLQYEPTEHQNGWVEGIASQRMLGTTSIRTMTHSISIQSSSHVRSIVLLSTTSVGETLFMRTTIAMMQCVITQLIRVISKVSS